MVEEIIWETVVRPGFFGKEKIKIIQGYNDKYGGGNWRISWIWDGRVIEDELAYQLYEDGYYADSFENEDKWKELIKAARDVYDHHPSDVYSGLDYLIQTGTATHLQDISVRRVLMRRGWKFEGNELIQVRKHSTYWGALFSPGKIPFHLPELIVDPHLEEWWDYDSVEDFYQSNKILQVKKEILDKL